MSILQPPGWPRPKGYANGISASTSLEAPAAGVLRRTSADIERVEEEELPTAPESSASAMDMMKELEALKREVDAARGVAAAD